jgi:hypothetical protein
VVSSKKTCHKGTKAQRNTKRFILKKTWCLGGTIFDVHKYIFFSLHQGPKPAQGMIHTLSLAPLGFLQTNNQLLINGCSGTGDTLKRPLKDYFRQPPEQLISPVPPRLYFLLILCVPPHFTTYRFNELNLKPPILVLQWGTSRVIRQGIQLTCGRQDYHPLRPPLQRGFFLTPSHPKSIKEYL